MVAMINRSGYLYQDEAVFEISKHFGDDYLAVNDAGNSAIPKLVLKEFRKLTPNVVWERGEKCWRIRTEGDEDTRQQIY